MSSGKEKIEKAKTYLKLALKTDQIVHQANEKLTEKTKSIFTLASALIPIVAGLGYFIAKETNVYWILLPIFFSLVMFVVAIGLGLWFFRPKSLDYVDPMVIVKKYRRENKSLRFFLNKWASTWCDTVNDNAKILNKKERGLNWMYTLIVVGLAILTLSFLFLAISLTNILSLAF